MFAELLIIIALSQTPERTVPVIFDMNKPPIILTESEAKRRLRRAYRMKNQKEISAYSIALAIKSHHCDHTPIDEEVECFDK